MTLLADIGALAAVFAWIGLALGVVVLAAVVALFYRVVQPALETERYVEDIHESAGQLGRNLEGAAELARTRALAGELGRATGAAGGGAEGR